MPGPQLQFLDYREPKLEAGDYTFRARHRYGDPAGGDRKTEESGEIKVRVAGVRTHISPEAIFARYPPPGAHGDYGDTLPHISLKKPTLPWERSAYKTDSGGEERYEPWLYLMVIHDLDVARGDARKPARMSIKDLKEDAFVPGKYYESLNGDDLLSEQEKTVTTVDVKKSFFDRLIASRKEDLEYLAHVRQRWATDEESGEKTDLLRELAVVVANRFAGTGGPEHPQGIRNHALLISLENYLDTDSDLYKCKGDEYIRFVALTDWWFVATPVKVNFEARTKALDVDALRLPDARRKEAEVVEFRDRLEAGMTAMPHQFRLGDKSISWYRGPCVPFGIEGVGADAETGASLLNDRERGLNGKETYVATDADRLLRYDPKEGMFDISYPSAYELGRFLALRNPEYLQALYRYKRDEARYVRLEKEDEDRKRDVADKGIAVKNLPYAKLNRNAHAKDSMFIKAWLAGLGRLEGIPLWYLIPDPALLPRESVRLFGIDRKWILSLWLGALSLGGRPPVTFALFGKIADEMAKELPCCGAFLRSDIVWAYPEQVVELKQIIEGGEKPVILPSVDLKKLQEKEGNNYADHMNGFKALPFVRKEQLAYDLLICLARKPFNYLSLSLPAEALHYGADRHVCGSGQVAYTKAISYGGKTVIEALEMPFADPEAGVVDAGKLAQGIMDELKDNDKVDTDYRNSLDAFRSARFGRYMVEGEPKAEFTLGDKSMPGGAS